MRSGIAFVLTCAVAGGGASKARASCGPGTGADEPLSLTATAIEIRRVPSVAFEMMQQELQALLEPTGVRLVWRRAGPSGETARNELRVVFLDGPARGLHAGKGVLAATLPTGPAPTIWVYTPTVVESLGPAADGPDTPRTRRALGLALGRVLAHELVHVLAPEVPHGHGVMAERFRLVALEQTRPALSSLSAHALERGARAWAGRGHRRGTPVAGGTATGGLGVSLAPEAP